MYLKGRTMKTARKINLLSLLVVCCLVVFGCRKKEEPGGGTSTNTGADQSQAISKAKTDAEKMDVEQLRAAALKCKAAAEAKTAEVEGLAQKLIGAMGADDADKRKKLNAQMEELRKSEEALYRQLEVYVNKLKDKGGDVSGLEL